MNIFEIFGFGDARRERERKQEAEHLRWEAAVAAEEKIQEIKDKQAKAFQELEQLHYLRDYCSGQIRFFHANGSLTTKELAEWYMEENSACLPVGLKRIFV